MVYILSSGEADYEKGYEKDYEEVVDRDSSEQVQADDIVGCYLTYTNEDSEEIREDLPLLDCVDAID